MASSISHKHAEAISALMDTVSNDKRLLILDLFNQCYSPTQIVEYLELPRSTLQSHINILIERGFIEKKDDRYGLTCLGIEFLNWINENIKPVAEQYTQLLHVIGEIHDLQKIPESFAIKLSVNMNSEYMRYEKALEFNVHEYKVLMDSIVVAFKSEGE